MKQYHYVQSEDIMSHTQSQLIPIEQIKHSPTKLEENKNHKLIKSIEDELFITHQTLKSYDIGLLEIEDTSWLVSQASDGFYLLSKDEGGWNWKKWDDGYLIDIDKTEPALFGITKLLHSDVKSRLFITQSIPDCLLLSQFYDNDFGVVGLTHTESDELSYSVINQLGKLIKQGVNQIYFITNKMYLTKPSTLASFARQVKNTYQDDVKVYILDIQHISSERISSLQEYIIARNPVTGLWKGAKEIVGRSSDEKEVIPVPISQIKSRKVEWLWEPYIPKKKITILSGDPGVGKSWVSLALAAEISKEVSEINGLQAHSANVLLLTAEDGPEDTIRPRLDNLGGDLDRIKIAAVIENDDSVTPAIVDLERQIVRLEQLITLTKPALVIVDPIQAFLNSSVNTNRTESVRQVLQPLASLASYYNTAFLVIRHLRKSQTARAIHNGMGSIDFTAAARSELLVGETNDGKKVIIHIKTNLSQKGGSIEFSIKDNVFSWEGPCEIDYSDLQPISASESKSQQKIAEKLLHNLLSAGPKPATVVQEEANRLGISKSTLQRAKQALTIESDRISDGNNGGGYWEWSLDEELQDTHDD